MNAARWEWISRLFLDACALTVDQRSAFLSGLCLDDSTVRDEVEKLLAADARSQRRGFLNATCPAQPARVSCADLGGHTGRGGRYSGTKIDRYELQELIGRGGTSEVYRGVRTNDREHES
jgi:hypothetical protein